MRFDSITDIAESTLVERLVADRYWRSTFFNVSGIDQAEALGCGVLMQGLPGEPLGDIDIILVPPGHPERVTVIEVKRVKVRNGNANKLHEFEKGVRQVGKLASVGFYQTYLYVIVVVDSRELNSGRVTYADGLTPELKSEIRQLITPYRLAPGVGLMHHELVQPMDHVPLGVGAYRGHLVRLAESRIQSAEVTQWVASKTGRRAA